MCLEGSESLLDVELPKSRTKTCFELPQYLRYFHSGMEHFKDTEDMTREEMLNALHVERQKNEVERQKNAALRFVLGVARALAQGPLPVELDCNPLSPRRLARVKWSRSMQTCRSSSLSPDWF